MDIKALARTLVVAGGLWCGLQPVYAQNTYFTHTIQKGETVYAIARIYGVGVQTLYELNPEAKNGIRCGDKLRLPQNIQPNGGKQFHTIQSGETLYRITQLYKVSAEAICRMNPGLSAENFKVGTVIAIPKPDTIQIATETPNPTPVAPQKKQQGIAGSNCREMHKVKRRQTLYSIAREYGISEEELKAANPETQAPDFKLKRGQFLCIPFAKPAEPVVKKTPSNAELFPTKAAAKKLSTVKVGVLLPLKDSSEKGRKMIEFYRGVLLAVDSLKQQGTNFEIFAYDCGSSITEMNAVLQKPGLQRLDVIFGPLQPEQIAPLAKHCKTNNIKLVVPFTSQCNVVYNNPYVYTINANHGELQNNMTTWVTRRFANYNHIIIDANDNDSDCRAFARSMQTALSAQGLKTQTISLATQESEWVKALNPFRDNLIVPNSSSLKTLNLLFPKLRKLVKEHPEYRITVMGYPEWQTYTHAHLQNFYTFNTYVFSPFYRNPLDSRTKAFEQKFTHWFHKPMIQSFPRFGLLGFDMGYYFLKGLAQYGSSFNDNLTNIRTLPYQHAFQFNRVSNWGGFVNRQVQLIHYTPNQSIELITQTP